MFVIWVFELFSVLKILLCIKKKIEIIHMKVI